MKLTHIFLYVVDRVDDPFEGIKHDLQEDSQQNNHTIIDIRLTDAQYAKVREVEYSWKKYIRIFYYRDIFRYLESQLTRYVLNSGNDDAVLVYTADEGVWAELLKGLKKRISKPVVTVNVQHGFLMLERGMLEQNRFVMLREFINVISSLLFRYPLLGLATGRGNNDIYLCYGESEKQFFESQGNRLVISCPRTIKYNLIRRFEQAANSNENVTNNAAKNARENTIDKQSAQGVLLVAMPACVPGSEIKCDLHQFLRELKPLLDIVSEKMGYRVLIRFHPGRDVEECRQIFHNIGFADSVNIDTNKDIAHSLFVCDSVLSAHSTVLFEAYLLGKIPIAFRSRCFSNELPYQCEIIDVRENFIETVERVLNQETKDKYAIKDKCWRSDWLSGVMGFISR